MLFKTLSASVYGIDAHLVQVEVDVGVGRMQDFNVVGLPDNAVKESRQRVQSAMKNCGFEFPYGQGVTINLAPADLRKEGSAFDLPMALGLAGCQGQFFGRVVAGRERAAGARGLVGGDCSTGQRDQSGGGAGDERERSGGGGGDRGLRAEVAAASGGFSELAGVVRTGEGGRAADAAGVGAVRCGSAGRAWAAGRKAGAGSGLRGRTQHFVHRTAGSGENDAGEADPDDSAGDVAGRSHRNDANSQRGGDSGECARVAGDAAFPFATPYDQRCGIDWRRSSAAAGRGVAGAQRSAVSGRVAGVSAECAGSDAAAAGGWRRNDLAGGDIRDISFAVHAGGGDESVPVRVFWRPSARLPLHAADDSAVCVEDFGAAAGPNRYSY